MTQKNYKGENRMKGKILVILFFFVPFFVMAQNGGLVEVRGIETEWEKYDLDKPINSSWLSNQADQKFAWGVIFTNRNKFSVSIDAELVNNAYISTYQRSILEKIVNTKSFILSPGEKYTWKLCFPQYDIQKGASDGRDPYSYVRFTAYRN
jgi:hypothetical protein